MKMHTLCALAACSLLAIQSQTFAAAVTGQGTWETTLQGRDVDGNAATAEAYYDTVLDITWLADANYAATAMDWVTANTWAANLDPYGSGITGWRLPNTNPIDGNTTDDLLLSYIGEEDHGYNISAPETAYAGSTASELAYLFYNTLGNLAAYDTLGDPFQPGSGLTNTGPFSGIQPVGYWSSTVWAAAPENTHASYFDFSTGLQSGYPIDISFNAWAVHSGDVGTATVSSVPVPAAVWLFGSGLLGVIGIAHKK